MRAWLGLVGLLAVVTMVGSGCGGGAMSRAGYRHEASHICRHANARVQRVDVAPLKDAAAASRGIGRVVAIHRGSLVSLRDLKPPKPDATTVDRWLAVVDQLLDEADVVRVALGAGDEIRARETATRAAVLDERARALASDYGITPCRLPPRSLGA